MVRSTAQNCSAMTLSNPEEYEKARDSKLFVTKCPELVGDAAAILEKIL